MRQRERGVRPHARQGRATVVAFSALLAGLAVVFGFLAPAFAAPTSEQDALAAVRGWLSLDRAPLGAAMAAQPFKVSPYADASGQTAYYVVSFEPAGFAVVSADDEVEPIVAFSPRGSFNPSPENPLGALVTQDVPSRLAAARARAALGQTLSAPASTARGRWGLLTGAATGNLAAPQGIASVSDERVSPLIQTTWDQSTAGGVNTYNIYTPNNYVSGCVATAMAQLMRFHQHPTAGVGTASFPISICGSDTTRSLRGGNGAGGPYDWASMVPSPNSGTTTAQRQAIGALTADAGVAVNMDYCTGGSGTDTLQAAYAFEHTFGYSNAVPAYNSGNNLHAANRDAMVNPNLDAGLPVLFGITGTPGGHAIVGDGYGYNLGTEYHHLNMGWSGSYNLWYNLPTIEIWSGESFSSVYKVVYNVYPSGSGEVISGRVTDANGAPISGATVTAVRSGGGTYAATTNAKGIYALAKVPSASSYTVSVAKNGYSFGSARAASTGTSGNYQPTTGNLWGVDFTGSIAASTGSLTVTLSPAQAVTAGAAWRVDSGEWQTSGATVTGLAAAAHTVEFKDTPGWTTPSAQNVTLTAGQTTAITATYAPLPTNSLSVTLAPAGAVNADARWRVDGGAWQESGVTVTDLITGEHTVSFKPVPGWLTPPPQTVAIAEGQAASVTGTYADASRAYLMDPAATYAWVDDAGATTVATDADDVYTTIALGFPFRFYGTDYTAVQASSNGFMSFVEIDLSFAINQPIPSTQAPNALIAAYWDDLIFLPAYGSKLSWQLTGTQPYRRMVVTWANGKQFDLIEANGPSISFQAILEETTNRIVLQYKAVDLGNASYSNGASATVGIEDQDGVNGIQYLYHTPLLTASQAISFTPGHAASLPLGALMLLLGD